MMKHVGAVLALALGISMPSFAAVEFAQADLCLVSDSQQQPIRVELALNNEQRAQGLMQRTQLANHQGMLFVYPGVAHRGFWMYRTLLPLDIAFLNDNGQIQQIMQMEPCTSSNAADCPVYEPVQAFKAALEMPLGYFTQQQLGPGDRLYGRNCRSVPWRN